MLVGGLAEASRRFGEWYEQNEPRIRRFSEVALQVLDGMPNWMSRCVVTFSPAGTGARRPWAGWISRSLWEAHRTRFALLRITELYLNGKFHDPEITPFRARRHPIVHGVFEG